MHFQYPEDTILERVSDGDEPLERTPTDEAQPSPRKRHGPSRATRRIDLDRVLPAVAKAIEVRQRLCAGVLRGF
jgi:hypothetical protein